MKNGCVALCVFLMSIMGAVFSAGLSQGDLRKVRAHIQPTYYQEYKYLHTLLNIKRSKKNDQEVMVVATVGQSSNIDLSAVMIQKVTRNGFDFIVRKGTQKLKDISVHKHGSVLDYWMAPFIGQFRAIGTYSVIKNDALVKSAAKRVGVIADPFVVVRFTPESLRFDLQLKSKEHQGHNMLYIFYNKNSVGQWRVTTRQAKDLIPKS